MFFSPTSARAVQYGGAVTYDCVQNIISESDTILKAEEVLRKDDNLEKYFRYVVSFEILTNSP